MSVSEMDDDAFTSWVRAKSPSLFRTAYLLLGDRGHAEDLVQTALTNVHQRWTKIENPDTYTRRVLINLVRTRRRLRRFTEQPMAHVPEVAAPDVISATDRRNDLWQRVHELPPRMRAVLVLRYFEDLPVAEIADILRCRPGTVKSQISRGLDRLRTGFADDRTATPVRIQGSTTP